MKKKNIDDIAREMGFEVKRNTDNDADYYLMDEEKEGFYKYNNRGERLVVSVMENPFGNTWSFAVLAIKKDNVVRDFQLNPLFKFSECLQEYVPNKEWLLKATNENFKIIMKEVLKRFFNDND